MTKIKLLVVLGLTVFLAGCSHQATTPESSRTEVVESIGSTMAGEPADAAAGQYVVFNEAAFAEAASVGRKRVLFFHANWCPTCKAARTEFQSNLDKIPADTTVFQVDYDTASELKEKHGITYQHTFVLVNSAGDALKKWNGGAVAELVANTQ